MVDLLREGDLCRIRSNPPPPTTIAKRLRGNHEWQDLKAIRKCFMCRVNVLSRGFGREVSGNSENAPKIRGGCKVCNVYLCRKGDCVLRFHEREDALGPIE